MMDLYVISIVISIIVFSIFWYRDKKNKGVYARGTYLAMLLTVITPILNIFFCLFLLIGWISSTGAIDRIADWLNKEI